MDRRSPLCAITAVWAAVSKRCVGEMKRCRQLSQVLVFRRRADA